MPFKTPIFENSPSTCTDKVKSVSPNNKNEVFLEYGTVPINTSDFQNTTKRPAAVTLLENVAAFPLEEARQPSQENVLGKKEETKIFVAKTGKENILDNNIKLGTVKKSSVNCAKVNKVTLKKVAKSVKKDKMNKTNGNKSIWMSAHKVKKPNTTSNNGVISFEQRDTSQNSYHSFQNTMSQESYQMALSQPPSSITHRQRLMWLQERREVGLWVECNHQHCKKWRYLPHMHDPTALPNLWYCHMNPDKRYNSCSAEEKCLTVAEEQDVIYSAYTAGSVVWARQLGYPWWPAMVDDSPDTEDYYWLDGFSDIPTHFNVVFFDNLDVTRCWLTPKQLQPFQTAKVSIKNGKYRDRILAAKRQAVHALTLGITERLKKFSFISRFSGPILSPKRIPTKREIKFENIKKKRATEVYSSSESDRDVQCLEMSDCEIKDSALEHLEDKIITPNKSQRLYNEKMSTYSLCKSSPSIQSDISNCAVVCGDRFVSEIAPDSNILKVSNRPVFEDSNHTTPLTTIENEGTVHGARSLAILEEAELMGTANTESTWQPPTSYSGMDDTTEDSYENLDVPSQQQTKITSTHGTRDGHLADSSSDEFEF